MYKLMLSDLDETLLVKHHVPEFNVEAIKAARKKGLKFVPATGRAYNMIPEILKEIDAYDQEGEYSICFNGALIVENKNNRILNFEEYRLKQLKCFLKRLEILMFVYLFSQLICVIFIMLILMRYSVKRIKRHRSLLLMNTIWMT